MISLGVFDDTADSFCYSMLGKAQLQATTLSHDEMTIIALVRHSSAESGFLSRRGLTLPR